MLFWFCLFYKSFDFKQVLNSSILFILCWLINWFYLFKRSFAGVGTFRKKQKYSQHRSCRTLKIQSSPRKSEEKTCKSIRFIVLWELCIWKNMGYSKRKSRFNNYSAPSRFHHWIPRHAWRSYLRFHFDDLYTHF